MSFTLLVTGTIAMSGPTAVKFSLFGDEIAVSPVNTFKKLQQGSSSVAATTIYTVTGPVTQAIVKTMVFANTAGTASAVVIYVDGTAAVNQVFQGTIPAGGTLTYGPAGWQMVDGTGIPLVTASPISATGDATGTQSGSVLPLVLATFGPGAVGPIGDASHVAAVTTDAKGRVSALSSVLISIPNTQVTGLGTLSTQNGTFSGTHSGSSSGTNTGDQTIGGLGGVPTSRLINTTAPITGGGDLSADRTLAISAATTAAAGSMSAIDKKKLGVWSDLVNELGADPTGNVDATAIITAWLLANVSATLFLPPNCRVRVDGPVAWNRESNFIGGERRTSIVSCGNATNNIFNVSSDGVLFEGFRVTAGAAGVDNATLRTAGYAFNFDNTSDSSGARKMDILFQWSGVHTSGSLQFCEDLNIREYGNNAINGQCILVDGIGDRYIRRITTDNGTNPTGFAGVRVQTCASLVISDCNIIHAGNALELSPGAGQTVPSVEAVNCFFDTSVNGLAVVPTGTGVVARSKFTNCWFGTHTTNGILLTNPGGATSSFEGLQFINCDIYGCPTGINAAAGGGKWEFQGAIAGCTTQAINLGGSAGHFPKIHNSVIGPHGLFGANALGIVIATGTYKGLIINDNSVVNNTGAALTLGAVTCAVGEFGFYRIIDNAGINPRGASVAPVNPPIAGTTYTNTSGFRVQVIAKNATASTAMVMNGLTYTVAIAALALVTVTLEPGGSISFTGGTYTSWSWITQ